MRFQTHIVFFSFILLLVALFSNEKILIFAVLTDFILHQYYRISLYTKKFLQWFILNFIGIMLVALLAGLSVFQIAIASENHIDFIFCVGLIFALFIIFRYISVGKIYLFIKEFSSLKTLYGIQRKTFINFDKIILSMLMSATEFWIVALVYQIFNAATTAYETLKIFPIKKEFSLKQISFKEENNIYLNIAFTSLSLFAAYIFIYLAKPIGDVMFFSIIILFGRTMILNSLIMKMEILFWKDHFNLMILWLSVINIVSLCLGYFIYISKLDLAGVWVMILGVLAYGMLNLLLRRYCL